MIQAREILFISDQNKIEKLQRRRLPHSVLRR